MPPTLQKRPNFYEADKRAGEKRKKSIKKVEEGAGLDEGRRLNDTPWHRCALAFCCFPSQPPAPRGEVDQPCNRDLNLGRRLINAGGGGGGTLAGSSPPVA